jgi:uncharacterized membrane protein
MNTTIRADAAANAHRQGVLAALAAFSIWGLAPLYFKAVGSIPPIEIVAHRVLWSLIFLSTLLAFWRGFDGLRQLRAQPRLIGLLAITSMLTGSNWLVFVWSISVDRLLEASLGYFINPLVSILLGRIFLGERMRPMQQAAVALAFAGVLWRVWQVGSLPVHQPRMQRTQRFAIESVLPQASDFEVLYQYIGLLRQSPHQHLALGVCKVDRHRALIAVRAPEVGRVCRIAAFGVLQVRWTP